MADDVVVDSVDWSIDIIVLNKKTSILEIF